jgi:hypothetical protein
MAKVFPLVLVLSMLSARCMGMGCSPFPPSAPPAPKVSLGGQSFQRVWTMNVTGQPALMHVSCISMSYATMFLADDLQPDFSLTLTGSSADKRRTSLAVFEQSHNGANFSTNVQGVVQVDLWARITNWADISKKLMKITGYPVVTATFE